MNLRNCESFKSGKELESANPQTTNLQIPQKDWVRKSQIRKVPHFRKVRKSNSYLSSQICGFVISGTYLRTVELWSRSLL